MPVSDGNGNCCPCEQFSSCSCGGIGCSLTCRAKVGDAELCGFAAFADPDTPARKYRRKDIDGTMYRGEWPSASCPTPANPTSMSGSGADNDPLHGDVNTWSYNFAPTGNVRLSDGFIEYRFTGQNYRDAGGTEHDGYTDVRLVGGDFAGETTLLITGASSPGGSATVWLDPTRVLCWNFRFGFRSGTGGCDGAGQFCHPNPCQNISNLPIRQHRDVWNYLAQYDPDDCGLAITDNLARFEKFQRDFPLTTGGDEVAWTVSPDDGPAAEYGSEVEAGSLTPPAEDSRWTRRTEGRELCGVSGPPYAKAQGTVTESLSDEDSDADAEARSKAAIADWTGGLCTSLTAFRTSRTTGFEFSYRAVQVKAQWTAVIGQTYRVKVRYARRLLGSAGPYVFHSLVEQDILADTVSETTDWLDVPNEAGWETIAANCSVELLP